MMLRSHSQVTQHDWLQQLCLMNILMFAQKYADDAKIATTKFILLHHACTSAIK